MSFAESDVVIEASDCESQLNETPLDTTTVDAPSGEATFQELGLDTGLLAAIESSGYTTATPIQARAIPPLLAGRDVLGQAQTGTGKTAAFALPMLQGLDISRAVPQVLVLTPTRELAIQVAEAFERYGSGLPGFRVAAVYGGQDYNVQFRELDRGVHVIVGTPGRVMDHLRRGTLKLNDLRGLVLDEADEMLRMGFAEDVEWVLTQTPSTRQIALFSATMPDEIRRIAQQHLRNPAEITIQERTSAAETVRQRFLVVPPPQKQMSLARVLEAEPIDGVIVFVKTKSTTEYLAEFLAGQGHRVAALSSDVVQKQRERIVDNLRAGKLDVIVATDVAARGLDVQRISHVINYDFPFDSESYVHRIGRTGRAGRTGDAILFLNTRERHLVRRIERATGQPIEQMDVPSKRLINQRRVARFHERITAAVARPDLDKFQSIIEQYRTQFPDVTVEQLGAALAAIAVGDTPFFVTEDPPQTGFRTPRSVREGGNARDGEGFRESGGGREAGRPSFAERPSFADRREDDRREGRENRPNRREERGSFERAPSGPMETYRIEVGRSHGVKPGNIVGAIANEAGLTSSYIGRIEIFDQHCFVDMLAGMSEQTFRTLQQVVVAGRPLNISRSGPMPAVRSAPKEFPRTAAKSRVPAKSYGKKAKPKKGKKFAGKR